MTIRRIALVAVLVASMPLSSRAQSCNVPNHIQIDWVGADTACTRDGVNPCAAMEQITFTATGGGEIPSCAVYRWDFGDGAISSLSSPAHAYAASANFQVSLEVRGSEGEVSTAGRAISVAPEHTCNLPNGVRIDWNGAHTGCKNDHVKPCAATEPITFTPIGLGGKLPPCAAFAWNFGDGTFPSILPGPTHQYVVAATFGVDLEVTGSGGQKIVDTAALSAFTILPALTFGASALSVLPGQTVVLSWTTQNARSVSIDGIAPELNKHLPTNGDVSVVMDKTTTYTLTAIGDAAQRSMSLTVEIVHTTPHRRAARY